ncbi:MAG: benzene 1,2-dioxygenase [Rhodospirillaceae bacterium]|nr:benzene 1,2-dioxygenase [Rhodospirillaceae bacterium]|tara:strand:+ start:5675 stop:6223 length:549 start_codon:yes stop_codon:yes gene_type:complete
MPQSKVQAAREGEAATLELQHQIESFLFHEAELLDDRLFDDWLDLFTDETSYVVPIRRNVDYKNAERAVGAPDELAHFDDDRTTLGYRVARLKSEVDWSEQPATRTRRIIGNVRVAPQSDGSRKVRSNFILYANRLETRTHVFAGERHDRLVADEQGDWRIADRRVLLDQSVILAPSLSVLF